MSDIVKTCIICPAGCPLTIRQDADGEWSVSGNRCARGKNYAVQEMTDPRRTVTATAETDSAEYPRLPLKSAQPVPMDKVPDVLEAITHLKIALPVQMGDCLLADAAGTGIDIVAARSLPPKC